MNKEFLYRLMGDILSMYLFRFFVTAFAWKESKIIAGLSSFFPFLYIQEYFLKKQSVS